MSHSEQINDLCAALAKAQGMMEAAKFNRVNPHFKSKYADLAAVWDAIRKPLAANGLSVTQVMDHVDGNWHLSTTLHHASGQYIRSYYPLPADAKPQEFGSWLTYARRYSLSAIVGIASDEDDDANEAQKAEIRPNIKTVNDPPGGKVVPLTEAQIENIRLYTSEMTQAQVDHMMTWLNVKSLNDIGQHQYDRTIGRLAKTVGRTLGSVPSPVGGGSADETVSERSDSAKRP